MLGNGNGTFQTQQTFATGSFPNSVATADVNGDGKPDLIVANGFSNNNVSVLLGNGNGTFQTRQTFATGSSPFSVSIADVNGDGKPDLIVANDLAGSVSVLLGNGNGAFQAQQTFLATGSKAYSLAVSDVNGDGKADVVVANYLNNSASVLLGNGNGTFQTQVSFAAGSSPQFITVVDLNSDGKPDLIVANSQSNTVSVLLGAGNGNFTGPAYTIVPSLDTINPIGGFNQIVLTQDPDNAHIDWTLNGSGPAQMAITDPNGLTINGNGPVNLITLQYSPNSPLPAILHLNGSFAINGLQGSNPLANTTLEIGRSTVLISYSSSDPLSLIQGYLKNGYNGGAWNGTPTASTGVIASIPAANNAAHTTAIGYADSADGLIAGQPANTIELKYTIYGDTTLTGTVGFNDFTRMTQHWNQTTGGAWDTGDFNYDGSVNGGDFTLMTRTYNTSLGNQAAPAVSAAQPAILAPISSNSTNLPSSKLTVQATPAPTTVPKPSRPRRTKNHSR
jgi:filamentous hemagglutinin family protein